MANKNALNKNSLYVQSLVDFILDTKPYHVKLTEIVEEYRFFDDVKVKIDERFSSKMKIDSTWMYNYFSSANPMFRTMPAHALTSPTFRAETRIVGKDENTDLALVPYVYSKKAFDGVGVNAVYVRHKDFTEALTESADYFQSHGSFQFQIKQTKNANGDLDPLWSSTPDDDLITEARRTTRANALDRNNPNSAINRISGFLLEINAAVKSIGGHADVQRELNDLFAIVNNNDLPQSYEALLAWLAIPNDRGILVPLDAPKDREYYEQRFSHYSSPLFFGMFTDLGVRESGRIEYANGQSAGIRVTNLKVTTGKEIEEWTFVGTDIPGLYRVNGSSSGFIGFVSPGDSFDNGRVSFNTSPVGDFVPGDTLSITPTRKIVIGADAPLETWNIIKVNPIAHDRPQFTSARFGHIEDLSGNIGGVSLLDPTLPTGDIVLTSRGDGIFFDLVSLVDPTYTSVVTVGEKFNDGRLGFTIVKGPTDFPKGDRFYISIENNPARAENLELGFGYDLDPYDDDTITKYPDGTNVGFYYDGRFTDYDLTSLNLKIAENAVNGRKWRLRALPDYTRPISTVPGLPTPAEDLRIYYAASFALEWSDDLTSWKPAEKDLTISIGSSYSSSVHGISFTIAEASRPFVAVNAPDGSGGPRIEGGDIFSFEVVNPAPRLVESPVGLSSIHTPRLIMHSDSFFDVKEATWTVAFTDANTYTVTGVNGDTTYGPITGKIATAGQDTREGLSFKDLGLHFTIVPTGGLGAGDKFVFHTFDEKPSYLVHGSVTGFTEPATVGKYYWNGKIGFKIRAPYITTYVGGQEVRVAYGQYKVREDCPSLIYRFVKNATGYQITRSDTGESGFGSATVPYQDKYLTIDLAGVTVPEFLLTVDAHDYPLWNTADVVIINPKLRSRLPANGEAVVIEKTEEGRFSLNLVPGTANVSALNPVTIDQRFIDTNTRGEKRVPLAQTSPETAVLQGWVPLTTTRMDSTTSVAEFSDSATSFVFKASSNNQTVGTLKNNVFEWDPTFYGQYLPLNAEANLMIQGTGWNDRVSARITESIKFLLGGGPLTEDWMFHDDIHVTIDEYNKIDTKLLFTKEYYDKAKIITRDSKGRPLTLGGMSPTTSDGDSINVNIEDGPFGGFLTGYDNVPYDTEGYDTSQPPDLQSMLSKYSMTDVERADIIGQWNNYLESPTIPTTEAQWAFLRAAIAGDPNPGFVTNDFGFPNVGMGMDIVTNPENAASASIVEAMTVRAVGKGNALEVNNFDIGLLDQLDENTVIMYSGSMPPLPTTIPAGTTYDNLETPLVVDEPALVFEISFNAPASVLATFSPKFSIWFPGATSAVQVAVVELVKPGVYRFSLARPSKLKITVG